MKKKFLSLSIVFVLLLAMLPVPASASVSGFEDVSPDDYFATAVQWAVSWGVTQGTSETTFSPDWICTRAQVVTFLWRAHGEPEPVSYFNPFADVPKGSYYERSTLWAVEQGITVGTSSEPMLFSPDRPCTYAQILTFIWRAKGSQAPAFRSPLTESWPDSAYYKDAVDWAYVNAMLEDEGDELDPDQPCTRGRTVAWLWREAMVYVSDVEGLMAAIGPGREIHLAPGVYNLTEWIDRIAGPEGPKSDNPYVWLDNLYDGYEVWIRNVRNLTITADNSWNPGKVELVVEPRYANVLTFDSCDQIVLSGLVMGHTPEQGYCMGGVLRLVDCGRFALSDMDLYGCGTYGIIAERVQSIQAVDSVIRDCSYGLLDFQQVQDAGFGDVVFQDCGGYDMINAQASSLFFQSCKFLNNVWDERYSHFLQIDQGSDLTFRYCTFDRPTYFDLTDYGMSGNNVTLERPTVLDRARG